MNLPANLATIHAPEQCVRVIGRLHQLAGERIERSFQAGLTVTEILEEIFADQNSDREVVVYIGDMLIDAKNYHRVRPKPGMTVIFVGRLLGGGAGAWRTVMEAVVALTAVILAAPTGGASLWLESLGVPAGISSALVATGTVAEGEIALRSLFD